MQLKCRFGVLEGDTQDDLVRMYIALGQSELEQIQRDARNLVIMQPNGTTVPFKLVVGM